MYQFLWIFFAYAFLGWCTEVCYAALVPIYGFGVVIVLLFLEPLKHNLLLLFLGSVLLTSALEWLTGFMLEKLFRQRWWDYSDEPFNLGGYICLRFSIAWGLACLFVVKIIHPTVLLAIRLIPRPVGLVLLGIMGLVMAVDLAATVRTIAKINRRDYGMEETLELVQGDLFSALEGRSFDIILSNPPYVTTASMEALPTEYRHEPSLALAAGADGMDVVRRMLPEAAKHLNDGGFLIVEVGDGLEAVEALFPGLELTWLSVSGGDDQVFMVTKEALLAYFA